MTKATDKNRTADNVEGIYKLVGERIGWLRHQRQWSCAHLAERLRLHASTLHMWEKATVRVKLSELVRIAHEFGVSLEFFLADLPVELAQPTADTLEHRRKSSALKARTLAARKAGRVTKPKKKK